MSASHLKAERPDGPSERQVKDLVGGASHHPNLYIHPGPAGQQSARSLSRPPPRVIQRSLQRLQRQEWERQKRLEQVLLLGIMMMTCFFVGIITYFIVAPDPDAATSVEAPQEEAPALEPEEFGVLGE